VMKHRISLLSSRRRPGSYLTYGNALINKIPACAQWCPQENAAFTSPACGRGGFLRFAKQALEIRVRALCACAQNKMLAHFIALTTKAALRLLSSALPQAGVLRTVASRMVRGHHWAKAGIHFKARPRQHEFCPRYRE